MELFFPSLPFTDFCVGFLRVLDNVAGRGLREAMGCMSSSRNIYILLVMKKSSSETPFTQTTPRMVPLKTVHLGGRRGLVLSLYPGWGAGGAYHLSPIGLHFCCQANAPEGHTLLVYYSGLS